MSEPAPPPQPPDEPPSPPPPAPPPPETAPTQVLPPEHRRSRGLVVLGVLLLVAGAIWLLAALGTVDVSPVVWLGGLLVLVGVALVVSPRGGHVGLLVTLGIVLALVGAALSTIDTSLLRGGIGDRDERPASAADIERYRLGIGSLRIDLTELADSSGTVDMTASVGIGELVVTVPAAAELRVRSRVSAGEIVIRGRSRSGIDVEHDATYPGLADPFSPAPTLDLDLRASLGSIRVEDG